MKPGPGHYRSRSEMNKQAYSFGLKLLETLVNLTPGPGAYDLKNDIAQNKNQGAVMGTGKREFDLDFNSSPVGPGQYNLKSSFEPGAHEHRGFTMGGKHEVRDRSDSPGPAAYSLLYKQTKDSIKNVVFGSGKRMDYGENDISDKPGPGQYENKSTLNK